jgi:hypothetical protein
MTLGESGPVLGLEMEQRKGGMEISVVKSLSSRSPARTPEEY